MCKLVAAEFWHRTAPAENSYTVGDEHCKTHDNAMYKQTERIIGNSHSARPYTQHNSIIELSRP